MHFPNPFACITSRHAGSTSNRPNTTEPKSNVAAPFVKSRPAQKLQPDSQSPQRGAMRVDHANRQVDAEVREPLLARIQKAMKDAESAETEARGPLLTKIQKAIEDVEKTQAKLQALTFYSARDARKFFKINIKTSEVQPYLQAKIREFALLKLKLEAELRQLSGELPTRQATGLPQPLEKENAVLEAELEQLCQVESPLQSPANRHASEPEPLNTPPQRTRFASESRDIQQRLQRDQLRNSPDSPRIASNPARSFEETIPLFMAAKHQQLRMSGDLLQASAESQTQSQTGPGQRPTDTPPKA